MRGKKKLLIYGALGAVLYYMWKQKQLNAVAAGAAAAAASGANAPNTNVAPTGASTTNNMQALAYADTGSLPAYGRGSGDRLAEYISGELSPGFSRQYPGTVRYVGSARTLMF